MGSLQRPVIFSAAHVNQAGAFKVPSYGAMVKPCNGNFSGFRGIKFVDRVNIPHPLHSRKNKTIKCSMYSSSNESNRKARDFMDGNKAYVNATVIETAEVRSSSEGLMVMFKDGKILRCVHNNHQGRYQPDYSMNPLIVLKIEDEIDLLLPILEKPSMQLMEVVGDAQMAMPSMYEVVMEMIEKMGYAVKLVRVAVGTHGSYSARLYLTKVNDIAEDISFDLLPSDAINIAIRCKASIHVERHLAYKDGLRIVEFAKHVAQRSSSDDDLFSSELDRPSDESCVDAKEFNLLRNMLVAAVEERYQDAAKLRDELNRLRSTWLWMFV